MPLFGMYYECVERDNYYRKKNQHSLTEMGELLQFKDHASSSGTLFLALGRGTQMEPMIKAA